MSNVSIGGNHTEYFTGSVRSCKELAMDGDQLADLTPCLGFHCNYHDVSRELKSGYAVSIADNIRLGGAVQGGERKENYRSSQISVRCKTPRFTVPNGTPLAIFDMNLER